MRELILSLRQICAYIKKEFLIRKSYRFSFWLSFLSVFTSLLTFFFINKLFGNKISPHLEPFGRDYFSYTILAQAFYTYVGTGLEGITGQLQEETAAGTLESILVSPMRFNTFLVSMALWNFLYASLELFLYLAVGILFFRIDFLQANILAAVSVIFLTIVSFSSIGLISGSFTLLFKRGSPINWLVETAGGILGGVYFPVTVLPLALQTIASWLPITYAVRALELAVYQGASLRDIPLEVGRLFLFTVILFPIGGISFGYALRQAKKEGNLSHY